MTALVAQMRLDSTRLPRKALLPLGRGTVADRVLWALSGVAAELKILATDAASAAELAPIASRGGFELFQGPKEDVLARFALALEGRGCEWLVRATGDNPFVSAECVNLLLEEAYARGGDYLAYDGLPYGMGVEVARVEALFAANDESTDPFEREHVMPFLYRRPERFSIRRLPCPEEWREPDCRVTIDTQGDYENALALLEASGEFASAREIIVAARNRGKSRVDA